MTSATEDPAGGREHGPVAAFASAVAAGRLELPLPAGGRTAERFDALWTLGRTDLTLARLGEAHADAAAILAEAGHPLPHPTRGLAVWAAEGPGSELLATPVADGLRLEGAKRWCSGAGIVSHALVTARSGDDRLLVLVALDAPGITIVDDGWVSGAFASTSTARVTFSTVVDRACVVGSNGFYLDRPGFWYGAVGVAACWAGGAAGLVDALQDRCRPGTHTDVALGAARAACWAMAAQLGSAAALIDSGALEHDESARQALALTVRHLVDELATDVVRRLTRAAGPGPLAHDASVVRRVAELELYLRQSHAERDLEVLGTLGWPPFGRIGSR